MDKLKIISYNCRGAMSSFAYINHLLIDCDIFCIQEHHLYAQHKQFLKTVHEKFTGEVVVCQENEEGLQIRKGGLAVLWKKNIDNSVSVLDLPITTDRIMGIRIDTTNQRPIFIINVYMPSTSHSIDEYRHVMDLLQVVIDYTFDNSVLYICGDFNGQLGPTWGIRAGPFCNPRGAVLGELLKYNNMISTVADPVCKGPVCTYWPDDDWHRPSQIDHILCNIDKMSLIVRANVYEDHVLNTSDHHPISVIINCSVPRYQVKQQVCYNWQKGDKTLYSQTVHNNIDHSVSKMVINTKSDIEHYLMALNNCLINARNECIPKSSMSMHRKPYWDEELKKLHKQQKQHRQIWILEGRPRGMEAFSYRMYKQSKRCFAKCLQRKQLLFEQGEYTKLESQCDLNPRNLYRYVRSKKDPVTRSSHAIIHNDVVYTSPVDLADLWAQHYQKLLNEQPHEAEEFDKEFENQVSSEIECLQAVFSCTKDDSGISTDTVTVNEVANVCKGLKNCKAPGHDSLTYECLKYGGHLLYKVLTYLYNSMLQHIHIPSSLKHNVIISVYKGKKKTKE